MGSHYSSMPIRLVPPICCTYNTGRDYTHRGTIIIIPKQTDEMV